MKNNISFPHFFIYDKNSESEVLNYEFGNSAIHNNDLEKVERYPTDNAFLNAFEKAFKLLDKGQNGLIVYIHGYMADNTLFMEKSGYILQKEVFEKSHPPYGIALSLQWTSPILYSHAVESALNKGRRFGDLLNKILKTIRKNSQNAPISFISHSMGNRVFQGLYDTLVEKQQELYIKRIFFMAADLESDIFSYGFPNIDQHSERIYVYHRQKDITLKIAQAINHKPRLGLMGTNKTSCPPNCINRDITVLNDDESFAGNITNHRYFYGSPTVRDEIIASLTET